MTRVLLADDLAWIRQGLTMRLTLEPDIEIVGAAQDGWEVVNLASSLLPDVIIMNVDMPGIDGIAATRLIHQAQPTCRIVMLGLRDNNATRQSALAAGADVFVSKSEPFEHLLAALRGIRFAPPSSA